MSRAKEASGRRAAEFVTDGMAVGLGTGSTVYFTLVRLAERIREEGLVLRGVATSRDTEEKAAELGIPLVDLKEVTHLDLTIDGADEIDADFQMIKGGGGALLREKIVAEASTREVIVVGRDKLVERLGRVFLLPVEVVPFAQHAVQRVLQKDGIQPTLRLADRGTPYLTDNGNLIFDCGFPDGIEDARATERRLKGLTGVVEVGLFIDLCQVVVVASDEGEVEVLEKERN